MHDLIDTSRSATWGPGTAARVIGALLLTIVGIQSLLQPGLARSQVEVALEEDETTLIASGGSVLPSDPIAWRVVRDTAYGIGETPFLERALGFAIADHGELELVGDGTGPNVAVEPDGAGFIPEAVQQVHVSPSGEPTPYLRIGLVPPVDSTYTAGGELVYPGVGFAAPAGVRELMLVRHRLSKGDEFRLADFGVPTLVVVAHGEVEVSEENERRILGESDAHAFSGEPSITATAPGRTLVYIAIIGGRVETPPAGGAPDTGEVWVFAHGCPFGEPALDAGIQDYLDVCGDPLVDTQFSLERDGQSLPQTTQIDIAAPWQSLAVWYDVPAGPLSIRSFRQAGYGGVTVFCNVGDGQERFVPIVSTNFTLDPEEMLVCHFFLRPLAEL